MRKIKKYISKVINHYRYHGLNGTWNAILYKVKLKLKLVKNNSYITGFEKYKNFDLNDEEKNTDILYKNGKNVYIFATVPYFDVGGGQRSS